MSSDSVAGHSRVLWANDARHYHLFVHEPPISELEVVQPVDEIAGSGVDTFVWMVARADGLFYPSDVGQRWPNAELMPQPFDLAAEYRVNANLRSLEARGLDPLQMLVDRAHEHGMEFIASLRVPACYAAAGSGVAYAAPPVGIGLGDPAVREAQLAVVRELATRYATEGV